MSSKTETLTYVVVGSWGDGPESVSETVTETGSVREATKAMHAATQYDQVAVYQRDAVGREIKVAERRATR